MCPALIALSLLAATTTAADESAYKVSSAKRQDSRILYKVESAFQPGKTRITVLLPNNIKEGESLRVLYLLPVEAQDSYRWGDPLAEIEKHNLHNKHKLICVLPGFAQLPWYADHPSDKAIRQESYFVNVVVPLVEEKHPVQCDPNGRLLLGFSKSGWGAWSLLLRHPDCFSRAVAWDAPLMKGRPDEFGMGPIFGTLENFEKYRLTTLLQDRADQLGQRTRLFLLGYDNFRTDHQRMHVLLTEWNIPHVYRDGPQQKHHWESGWVSRAVELLLDP